MTMARPLSSGRVQSVRPSRIALRDRIVWSRVGVLLAFHGLAVLALLELNGFNVTGCIILHALTGGLGISVGYHRLLAHRSFEAPHWLVSILATLGALAWQGGPLAWVASHRSHHRHADQVGDPHSRALGWWWSHCLWSIFRAPNGFRYRSMARQVPDLNLPYLLFLERHYLAINLAVVVFSMLILGISNTLVLVFLRVVVVWHCTWLVNSCCHSRGVNTNESKPTNQWWVAALTYGEGMHLNHHGSPASATFDRRPIVDPGGAFIRLLASHSIVQFPRRREDG
jgi:stearoyl-CoA desaturase (delta-9 desaturase)